MQGKPAYFDVSVRNSLQPQFLCRAASLAGAAGEAGEMAKDARHEEGVIAATGCCFVFVFVFVFIIIVSVYYYYYCFIIIIIVLLLLLIKKINFVFYL